MTQRTPYMDPGRTHALKFLGICDQCRTAKTFGSEEARTHWEETHHVDAFEDRLRAAELEVEAAQKRVMALQAQLSAARAEWEADPHPHGEEDNDE